MYDESDIIEKEPRMSLDPELLRRAMRAWTSGVTIVTAAHEGRQHGMTVSSFTSVALEPPLVMVSLQIGARTHELVRLSSHFGLTVLAEDQRELSARFAGQVADGDDRMAGLAVSTLVSGAPLLEGGLAWLDCRVTQAIPAGTNTLFLAEVLEARAFEHGRPLVYFDRDYRRLETG